MSRYAIYGKYTPEALAAVRQAGYRSRETQMKALTESLGGRIEAAYFMPSAQWDFMAVAEIPDSAGLFAMLSMAGATGSFERGDVVELYTASEADAAIGAHLSWKAPGEA